MQIVGNYDIDTIYFTGLAAMIILVIGFAFMIGSLVFKYKNYDKESFALKTLSNSLYICSIILLIFWATFTIVNQINAMINLRI